MADARLEEAKRQGYETRDVGVRGLLAVVAATTLTVLAIIAAIWGLLVLFESLRLAPPASPLARIEVLPPEPRLEARPAEALVELERQEEGRLGSYGWVDQDAGIARIPLEQAMELLAGQGWPAEGTSAWPDREARARSGEGGS